MSADVRILSCHCGQVKFEAPQEPILTGVCYCDDCQAGGHMIEALPKAQPALEPDGGASYLTYRDDRFRCVAGGELLVAYKLKDRSPTQRFVASCCNSAMYLKYKRGHWVSTFRNRYESADLPKIEMRSNTRFYMSNEPLPDDVPSYKRFPLSLFGKLIKARIDMALGR